MGGDYGHQTGKGLQTLSYFCEGLLCCAAASVNPVALHSNRFVDCMERKTREQKQSKWRIFGTDSGSFISVTLHVI